MFFIYSGKSNIIVKDPIYPHVMFMLIYQTINLMFC
jgi:hypothetical protein